MDDIRLKETAFEWGGKIYKLRCNMNVIADVQLELGGDLLKGMTKGSLKSVLCFFAAMLNDYADEMGWTERYTRAEIGRQIGCDFTLTGKIQNAVMPLVASAMFKANNKNDKSEAENPQTLGEERA